MDPFDFDEPAERSRGGASSALLNIATLFFVISTLCIMGYYGYIYLNPNSPANLLRPGTDVVVVNPTTPPGVIASPTAGGDPTIPTATTEPTATVGGITQDPTATLGLLPSATAFQIDDATATAVPIGRPFFAVQPGNPTYLPHADGCGAMYVGGNVIDINGGPKIFMTIRLTGTLNGVSLGIEDSLSVSAPQYGEAGYEIRIGSGAPENSNGSAFVQMMDQEGQPASEVIFFDTFDDCNKNLIMINFVQTQ